MDTTNELDWLEELAAKAKPSFLGRHSRANSAFISACSPEVVSSLIRRLKEAKADVEEAKNFRDGYKEIANLERIRAEAAEGELIIPLADLVGPEGGALMQVTKLYEQARAEAKRFEAERDKWRDAMMQAEAAKNAAEGEVRIIRDRVAPTIKKIEEQLRQPSSEFWLTVSADEGRELVNALSSPTVHICGECADCLHDNNKCCGCYDNACCRATFEQDEG